MGAGDATTASEMHIDTLVDMHATVPEMDAPEMDAPEMDVDQVGWCEGQACGYTLRHLQRRRP